MSVKEIQKLTQIKRDTEIYGIQKPESDILHMLNGCCGHTFCNKHSREKQDKVYRIDVSVPLHLMLCSSCRRCKPYRIDKIYTIVPDLRRLL